jgi:hypothetical protein
MGILRVNEQEIDIYSNAYIFQITESSAHILGLKDGELERILGILGHIQSVIVKANIIGDSVQIKYRIGKQSDQVLNEDQELQLKLLSTAPYLDVRNIGQVNQLARQSMHNSR